MRQVESGLVLGLVCLAIAAAQTPPAPATPPAGAGQTAPAAPVTTPPNAPETVTKDEPATFRTRVNLVMVPVVVRDRSGKVVGGLHQEDFQLFDRGKPQVITRFTVERSGIHINRPTGSPDPKGAEHLPPDAPDRFIAYLFDDLHLAFADLARMREAAMANMERMSPTERAAVYSTSGQTVQDFTDDRARLKEALFQLMPRPIDHRGPMECPDISYHMADLIFNHNDQSALAAAVTEAMICLHLDASQRQQAIQMVQAFASRNVSVGNQEVRVGLSVIRDVIRRMSGMPGQRTIILASPGFITPEAQTEKTEILDRAIRANVIINAIDARGLYTDSTFDSSRPGPVDMNVGIVKQQIDRESQRLQADVLAELSTGTGGTFVENTNDLEGGFRRVGAAPEYVYILGFSPQNLKLDGTFHSLKVAIKDPAGLSSSARRGYYAPKRLTDAEENAKEELREAVFSREELHELPIELHTQFFKASDDKARITVVTRVDLKQLKLRKAEGRNRNDLTIVSAIFDRNGNYVAGNQKLLQMRLKDETIVQRAESGLTIRSTFDVKPGVYLVRLVVRDAEGQQMSAANGAVEIP